MTDRPWTQQTVIAPVDVADAARADANRTTAGLPRDPDHEEYVPDHEVPEVTLGAGVPLIGADDPDDAPVKAVAWDLRVRDEWSDEFARGVNAYGLTVYVRPDDAESMSDAIADAGYRKSPNG
jgi:hypothetical protein